MCHGPRTGKTFGEAIIVAIALGGFLYLSSKGPMLTVSGYIVVLAITAAFYAALLLVRAVFTFMTSSDDFWWKKYENVEAHHHNHKHSHHPDQPQGH